MKAAISYLNGIFWLRYNQETIRIPVIHTSSQEKLSEYMENKYPNVEI